MSRALLALLLVATLSGCPPASSAPCVTDSECPEGRCRFGGCGPMCLDDTDCPSGQACSDGACGARPECAEPGDCAQGFECSEGQCLCGSDAACASNQLCRQGRCINDASVDCPAGQHCTSPTAGRCQEYRVCQSHAECPENTDCRAFSASACPPGFDCALKICQELPRCLIDADCTAPAFCQQGYSRSSSSPSPERASRSSPAATRSRWRSPARPASSRWGSPRAPAAPPSRWDTAAGADPAPQRRALRRCRDRNARYLGIRYPGRGGPRRHHRPARPSLLAAYPGGRPPLPAHAGWHILRGPAHLHAWRGVLDSALAGGRRAGSHHLHRPSKPARRAAPAPAGPALASSPGPASGNRGRPVEPGIRYRRDSINGSFSSHYLGRPDGCGRSHPDGSVAPPGCLLAGAFLVK